MTSKVLALPMHMLEVDVTRLGGGFGGKEDQANTWAALCALATYHLKRPVKYSLNRMEDMRMTGKRHPYSSDYKIGLDKDLKIIAYEATFYQNAGAAADLSPAVMERTLFHCTNSYFIPNVQATAYSCRTNLPPNTAFRGFGGPQGMFVIESAIAHAADELGIPASEIQRRNLIRNGDEFPYGQVAASEENECWDKAEKIYDLEKDALVVTFVGRIQPHKGPEVLIRAICELVKHSPAMRPKLIVNIIGGASGANSEEVERLKELASWLGIDGVVRFAPPVSRADLPQWYRAADLVCIPSYSESFGLVALEAQACGTPVVATAVGGLRTAVADGISGVLVDGHDPKAWSSVIARLLQEPQRRVLLSMGAIEHASHFGWDATARGTLDIYDQVITENNAAAKMVGE